MDWRETVWSKPYHSIHGDGFIVKLHSRSGLQYSRGNRNLTVLTEVVDETEALGRRFLVLPFLITLIYFPRTLRWDDGTPVEAEEAPIVVEQITNAVKKKNKHCRVVIGDEIYEEVTRRIREVERETKRGRSE